MPAARTHGSVHLEVGTLDGLIVTHGDGSVSIRVNADAVDVWLGGTPDDLHAFASEIHRHANRAARRLVRPPAPDVVGDEPVVLPRIDEPAA